MRFKIFLLQIGLNASYPLQDQFYAELVVETTGLCTQILGKLEEKVIPFHRKHSQTYASRATWSMQIHLLISPTSTGHSKISNLFSALTFSFDRWTAHRVCCISRFHHYFIFNCPARCAFAHWHMLVVLCQKLRVSFYGYYRLGGSCRIAM